MVANLDKNHGPRDGLEVKWMSSTEDGVCDRTDRPNVYLCRILFVDLVRGHYAFVIAVRPRLVAQQKHLWCRIFVRSGRRGHHVGVSLIRVRWPRLVSREPKVGHFD